MAKVEVKPIYGDIITVKSTRELIESRAKVYKEKGIDFIIEDSGSVKKLIEPKGFVMEYFDKSSLITGVSLLRDFRKTIKDNIILGKIEVDYDLKEAPIQFINVDLIKSNIGKQLLYIDIKGCYWRTAYNLGYISKEMYLKGSIPKYKLARNTAIGSLVKTTYREHYIAGELSEREVIKPSEEFVFVRNKIIRTVWDLAVEFHKKSKWGLFMFTTDCFAIDREDYELLVDITCKYHYELSYNNIVFKAVDEAKHKIMYWDRNKDEASKSYHYSKIPNCHINYGYGNWFDIKKWIAENEK